jgi:hypothetical protein
MSDEYFDDCRAMDSQPLSLHSIKSPLCEEEFADLHVLLRALPHGFDYLTTSSASVDTEHAFSRVHLSLSFAF